MIFSSKRTVCLALVCCAAVDVGAATLPIYVNSSPFVSPPAVTNIDARAWVNRALFDYTSPTGLPFESLNTRFFTNTSTMIFDPGVRFQRNANGQRFWMDEWVNRGSITADHDSFFSSFFIFDSRASILQVAATNITATGPLFAGAHGLIRLEGNTIDLTRNALRTGSSLLSSSFFGGGFLLGASNYLNDVGVTDLYWGAGSGDAVANNRISTMQVGSPGGSPNFTLPNPSSTVHEVLNSFSTVAFPSSTIVPGSFFSGTNFFFNTSFGNYAAAAYTNTINATSRVVQVVFYPTNGTDPGFTTEVRFSPRGRAAVAVVGFHSSEFDIATQSEITNSVFFSDGLAVTTNYFFARNLGPNTRRPNTFEITRSMSSDYALGITGNVAFTPELIYNPNFTETEVTNRYAAYGASVGLLSSSPSGSIPYNVTNVPGRIEILGGEVNLDLTRIRAESAVIIKADNLVSNYLAEVDAPLVNFDVRSTQPTLVISNLAPQTVRRLTGSVRGWSAKWENFEPVVTGTNVSTNTVVFHVLIVESQLRSLVPVSVHEFAVRGTNIVISDQLNIGRSFVVEGSSFHLTGGLTLPFASSLNASTLLNVRHFTNDGVINISGSEFFGTDRVLNYSNYVNHGTNIAASHEIRTRNFENTGLIMANGGEFSLDALSASLVGNPLITSNFLSTNLSFTIFGTRQTNVFTNTVVVQTAPSIQGSSDVRIQARDLVASNSVISAGRLILSVTNSLLDSGGGATNLWSATEGFQFLRRPATSDLMGTHLRSTTRRFGVAEHVWAGADLGLDPAGFTNNLALGKLTLDGGDRSLFRFSGTETANALYVDYIELLNYATNYFPIAGVPFPYAINPNLTIYFANANVPVSKLDGAAGGRFRWVSSFTGPLSSTNITYPSGSNYVFNIALVSSTDLDSDGDRIVNSDDDTPIYVAESAVLAVSLASDPIPQLLLNWNALGYSSNYLEFKASAGETDWQVLTNFHQGPLTWPVTVADPITSTGTSRVYRLRVDPGPY